MNTFEKNGMVSRPEQEQVMPRHFEESRALMGNDIYVSTSSQFFIHVFHW